MDAAREVGGAGHLTRVVDAVRLRVAPAQPGDRGHLAAGAEPGHVVPVRVLPDAGGLADAVVAVALRFLNGLLGRLDDVVDALARLGRERFLHDGLLGVSPYLPAPEYVGAGR